MRKGRKRGGEKGWVHLTDNLGELIKNPCSDKAEGRILHYGEHDGTKKERGERGERRGIPIPTLSKTLGDSSFIFLRRTICLRKTTSQEGGKERRIVHLVRRGGISDHILSKGKAASEMETLAFKGGKKGRGGGGGSFSLEVRRLVKERKKR